MHTKNHEYCSQIECFMSQKPLAPKFLSQTVYIYIYICMCMFCMCVYSICYNYRKGFTRLIFEVSTTPNSFMLEYIYHVFHF